MSPDHLLRTLASVPAGSRVLELNCREGALTVPLLRLGFDVYACDPGESAAEAARRQVAALRGADEAAARVSVAHVEALGFADASFDWIVAFDAFDGVHGHDALRTALAALRRILKDGGWIYLTVPAVPDALLPGADHPGYAGDSGLVLTFTPETLRAELEAAGFAEAQPPASTVVDGRPVLQAIFRRVDADTPK